MLIAINKYLIKICYENLYSIACNKKYSQHTDKWNQNHLLSICNYSVCNRPYQTCACIIWQADNTLLFTVQSVSFDSMFNVPQFFLTHTITFFFVIWCIYDPVSKIGGFTYDYFTSVQLEFVILFRFSETHVESILIWNFN